MKLKYIYTLFLGAFLLSSCKSDEPAEPVNGTTEIPVEFTISLATESGTRAEDDQTVPSIWEDGENKSEGGTSFDNLINTVIPVLYEVKNNKIVATPVGTLVKLQKKEQKKDINDNVIDGEWVVSAIMSCTHKPSQLTDDNNHYRLALFINSTSSDIKTGITPATAGSATFYHHGIPGDNRDAALGSVAFTGIPMYGVLQVKFKSEPGGVNMTTALGDEDVVVPVLRSMAKVRVGLNSELANSGKVKLKSLEMERHALEGYVCPNSWNTVDGLSQTADNSKKYMRAKKGQLNSAYNHNCPISNSSNYPKESWANSNKKIRFYLPDTYNNIHDDITSDEIYFKVVYEVEGQEYTHYMWFRPFDEWPKEKADGSVPEVTNTNEPWDIIRNHIYEFIITGVEDPFNLKVDVSVNKWDYKKIPGVEL